MADTVHIEEQLRGLWPTSQKLTLQFIAEMGKAFEPLTNTQFDEALEKHRSGIDANKVPNPKQLASACGVVVHDDRKLMGMLAVSITSFGWDEAVRRAYQFDLGWGSQLDCALRDWMIRVGINMQSEKYYGFPFWFNVFCEKLHENEDVVDAYLYASREVPESNRSWYANKHKFFDTAGNEQAKRYFPYFIDKYRENNKKEPHKEISEMNEKLTDIDPTEFMNEKDIPF